MSNEVDLSALRMEEQPASKPPRRPRGPRVAAFVVALLLVGTLVTFVVPWLRPRRAVTTAAVAAAGQGAASRATAAEAAGWAEPDPFPVVVRPAVDGLVQELLVLSGDEVKANETVIARLHAPDVDAAHERARAQLALAGARLAEAKAAERTARALLEQKGDLRRALQDVRGGVDAARAGLAAAEAQVEAADARRDARAAEVAAQERLAEAGSSYPVALARARAALREAEAEHEERRRVVDAARAALATATGRLEVVQELHDDPRGLAGALATAEAAVVRADAELQVAQVEARVAAERVGWKTVRAPVSGTVLKLRAVPGAEVGPRGEAVAEVYDPRRLQVRVDVLLPSVGAVAVGQRAEVRSEALGSAVVAGTVTRIHRVADLQKASHQVKVRLEDPPPLLRPETLCRVRFLADARSPAAGPALFRVPRSGVRDGAVFVFDPTGGGRARRVAVEIVEESGESAVVRGPLSVAQRVILDPVEDGERVEEKR